MMMTNTRPPKLTIAAMRNPIDNHSTTTTMATASTRLIMKSLIAVETASDCHEMR